MHTANHSFRPTRKHVFAKAKLLVMLCFQENKDEAFLFFFWAMGLD